MKTAPIRWAAAALLLFWGPTAATFLIEYGTEEKGPNGERWRLLEAALTVPMLLGVVAGVGLWAFAVVAAASQRKRIASSTGVVVLGVLFAAANLVAYFLAQLWFVIDVMSWDAL